MLPPTGILARAQIFVSVGPVSGKTHRRVMISIRPSSGLSAVARRFRRLSRMVAIRETIGKAVGPFDRLVGGENGITGVWPEGLFESRDAFYYLAVGCLIISMIFIYRVLFSPFGYALRAARDSAVRAESIGMHVNRLQWLCFLLAASVAGLAGGLYAFSKGSVSPEILFATRSIEGLVMVVLGGEFAIGGGALGAAVFVWLRDTIGYNAEYWRAALGAITIFLLLVLPQGLASLVHVAARIRGGRT